MAMATASECVFPVARPAKDAALTIMLQVGTRLNVFSQNAESLQIK